MKITNRLGIILLAVFLILFGLSAFATMPTVVLQINAGIAIVAGVLLLVDR